MSTKTIKEYHKACNDVVRAFAKKYYDWETLDEDNFFWVGNEIGGVAAINDEFWDMEKMVTALELSAKSKDLFDWYYDYDNPKRPNLNNYLKYTNSCSKGGICQIQK